MKGKPALLLSQQLLFVAIKKEYVRLFQKITNDPT